MRFSIVVPVYNVEKYLNECVDSILNQSFTDFELILVDDGSKDNSPAICDKYEASDSRVKVIHKVNGGVSAARNTGIDNCSGEWIVFVDSDDSIGKSLLEDCNNAINETKAEICCFELTEDESLIKTNSNKGAYQQFGKAEIENLQVAIFNRDCQTFARDLIKAPHPAKCFLRSVINDNGLRFNEKLTNGEDGIFNLYYLQNISRGVYVKEKLYFYRQCENSITHRFTPNVVDDFNKLHVEYDAFIKKYNDSVVIPHLDERLIWSFSFCCILNFCHPNNDKKYADRKKDFSKTYEIYADAIKRVSLKSFGLKKKIMFCFIKLRLFSGVNLLCSLQNKL